MKETIYYADLTPCDDLHNYKEDAYIPKFIEEDTKHFDTKPPLEVVQLATRLGWCIVAKWDNNGSTRIYAKNEGAVRNGVKILRGICGSCNCDYAFGNEVVYSKEIIEKDIYVFDGHTLGNDKEYMKQYMEEVDETAGNYEQRKRRLRFYSRNGYVQTGFFLDYNGIVLEVLCDSENFDYETFSNMLKKIRITEQPLFLFRKDCE